MADAVASTRTARTSNPVLAWTYEAGAVCYVLWGLWHVRVVYNLWAFASSTEAAVQPRLEQGAFRILGFALCAIGVGLFLNWKNSRWGYGINLLAITWTEIGLFAIIVPALPAIPLSFWIGPVLWALAVALTTVGVFEHARSGEEDCARTSYVLSPGRS